MNVTSDIGDSRNRTQITGNTSTDLVKNIYDLYGCNREWTLSAYLFSSRVSRGATNFSNGPLCNHYYDYSSEQDKASSSRLTLHIIKDLRNCK